MKLSCVPRLIFITGLLSLFVLGGDIVADSIADACGHHCVSETSRSDTDHEKTPCSHCSCAVHNGAVVASTCVVGVSCALGVSLSSDEWRVDSLSVARCDRPSASARLTTERRCGVSASLSAQVSFVAQRRRVVAFTHFLPNNVDLHSSEITGSERDCARVRACHRRNAGSAGQTSAPAKSRIKLLRRGDRCGERSSAHCANHS
jgi:hypothetical protein